MAKRKVTEDERKLEADASPVEETPEVTRPEDEVHPLIDDETPHVDPTGAADFDRPYDQWSNDDLKIRAKQLGIQGTIGHGALIDAIREAEQKLAEREAETADAS